jgi:D-aspartate ligase
MDKMSVLIPDGESPFAYHVLNCLANVDDVDVHILSEEANALTRYSRTTKSFHLLKQGRSLVDGVADVCSRVHVDLCMPVGADGIYYFAQHREKIEGITKLLLMESSDMLTNVGDKARFADLLRSQDLPHPYSITSRAQLDEEIDSLAFPVLVKSRGGGGGEGIDKYENRHNLLGRVNGQQNFFEEFIIQEYVEGDDVDCSTFCRDGKILAYTMQRGLYVDPKSCLPVEAIELIHHPGVLDVATKLVSALKWNGIAHIDMRVRRSDRSICVIEINPRFWGSLEGSLYAGVNFPYIACLASLGRTFPMPEYRDSRYMSAFTAVRRMMKRKPVVHLFKETNLLSHLKDPLPVLMRLSRSGS